MLDGRVSKRKMRKCSRAVLIYLTQSRDDAKKRKVKSVMKTEYARRMRATRGHDKVRAAA
jgi:hypothetical protein